VTKQTANVPEGSFAVGGLEKGDFVLVMLAEKRSIYHYRAETVSYFNHCPANMENMVSS
jgi:hypothetical protein